MQGAYTYISSQVHNPHTGDRILDHHLIREARNDQMLEVTRLRAFDTKQETKPIPANANLSRAYWVEDLEDMEPLKFLVEDLVMEKSVGLIWGKSGSGKTAFAMDLALSVATGRGFAGRRTQACNVLYVALEGSHGAAQRLIVARRHKGLELKSRFLFRDSPLNIGNEADMNGLALYALQNNCKLIVIDTLSASLMGTLSENDNDDMALIVSSLYGLPRQASAAVLVVHHSGHDGRNERGASVLRCNVDTSIKISVSGKRRTWTVVKQKDGEDGISGSFDLIPVEVTREDGQIVSSIVVKHRDASNETSEGKKAPQEPRQTGNSEKAMEQFSREWHSRISGVPEDQIASLTIPFKEAKDACTPHMACNDPARRGDRAAEALMRLVKSGLLEQRPDKSLRLPPAK